ncbi:MAG: hypothetical protein AB7I41_13515 [Candidatus Sericytochromatia bacterium]
MVSFLTVMSHLILQTSLQPTQIHSRFSGLESACPVFVKSWLASDQQELLLEIALPGQSQREYLALRPLSGGQMILHLLREGEALDYKQLQPSLQGLLNWLKENDAQLKLLRHTFGQNVALSPSSLS